VGSVTELRRLFNARLAESGLTAADAKRLRFTVLNASALSKLDRAFASRGGFKLPYFHLDGSVNRSFYRVRYLEAPSGFASNIDPKKQRRYAQPVNSGVSIYLPPYLKWDALARDPQRAVVLTEGEMKAAKATREGFPTIGLGGVYSWRSAARGEPFLRELDAFDWKGREVYIAFDSDILWKPEVRSAMVHLCDALLDRGAVPHEVSLSDTAGSTTTKLGLDDFLVARGADAFNDRLERSTLYEPARALWNLRDRLVYVHDPELVYDRDTDRQYSIHHFKTAFGNQRVPVQRLDGRSGKLKVSEQPLPDLWLRWPYRYDLSKLVYEPGAAVVTEDGGLNLWRGWGCEPKKGNTKPWQKLLRFIMNDDDEKVAWFEQWCAMQLQYPGTKLATAVVVWGIHQGTGKSQLGYTLGDIFGAANWSEIGPTVLHSPFNDWAVGKQFVMGDEIAGEDRRADSALIKRLVTQKTLRVNVKYLRAYDVRDCANYYFNSNHPDPVYIERSDRRFFVNEITRPPLDRTFYREYDAWRRSGGAAHLFHRLLEDVDTANFGPFDPAMVTEEKTEMQRLTVSDVDAWLLGLREDPAQVLRTKEPSDLWSADQLYHLYQSTTSTSRLTLIGFGRALVRNGFQKVNHRRAVRTRTGVKYLYAVANEERWSKASPIAIAKHYDDHFGVKTESSREKF
jgi:hypothetical protein